MEIWLRTNRRVLGLLMAPAVVLALVGVSLAVPWTSESPAWLRLLGGVLIALALAILALLAARMRQPRLAYRDRRLLFWLRPGEPIEVPLEFVECFWLGQAPSFLPGKVHEHTETAAIVARIADRAEDFRRQDVHPSLGKWCEGYVTIRGTWCEPLNLDVVNRLNHRLAELHRSLK